MMNEVATALGGVTGLRVYPWAQKTITPPGAVLSLPDSIDYHGTYGTGQEMINDLVCVVMLGKASERAALKNLGPYVAGSGAKSVKTVLEAYAYTTCHTLTVTSVEFPEMTLAGVEYLAALFHIDIVGTAA